MEDINNGLNENILDPLVIYKYGLYVSTILGDIKGIDRKKITYIYEQLPIKDRNEIAISGDEIMEILNKEPGPYLKEIIDDIEKKIIIGELFNDSTILEEYVNKKYTN